MPTIVLKYPPDYDGELHIHYTQTASTTRGVGDLLEVKINLRMQPGQSVAQALQALGTDMHTKIKPR